MKRRGVAAPGNGGLFYFAFKDGSVFIVFEEDTNKAEAREGEGHGGDNWESG